MTRIKVDIGCLAKLLKKEPIVKLVEELPDRETAELNYIYVVPKDTEGSDKRAYVLRPNRDKWDTIDLTPKEISVVGADLITVDEEVTNENGDTTFTVRQSAEMDKELAQLKAVDTDLRNRVVVLENKEDLDKQQLSLDDNRLSISNGNTVILPEYDDTEVKAGIKANETSIEQTNKNLEALQEHTDGRLTTLENKVDNDNQTLTFSEGTLTISGGNSVVIPDTIYDDSEIRNNLANLNAGVVANHNKLNTLKSEVDENNTTLSNRVTELENKPDKDTIYDDTGVKARLTALETKEDSDKQTLSLFDTTLSISNGNSVELPKYDDSEVKKQIKAVDGRVTNLEEKTKNFITDAQVSKEGSTVKLSYTKLDGSVKEIDFEDNDTLALAYDDEPIKARIKALEDKPDVDTIYDDSAIQKRVKALEDKPDKDEQTLAFTDSSRDLTISNGNTVNVPEHSLDTILRLEGSFTNGSLADLKAVLEVYYDGQRVTEGYTAEVFWRGIRATNQRDTDNANWTKIANPNINSEGHIQAVMFSSPVYKGKALEIMSKVTYKGLSAYEYDHLVNETTNNTVVSSNQQGVTITSSTATVEGTPTTTYNIAVDTSLTTGKSAYDLWLEAGNKGTQQDFLNSLKGDKGDVTDIGNNAVKKFIVTLESNVGHSSLNVQDQRKTLSWNSKTELGILHLDIQPKAKLSVGRPFGRLPQGAPKPVSLIEINAVGTDGKVNQIWVDTNGNISSNGLNQNVRYIADLIGYFK